MITVVRDLLRPGPKTEVGTAMEDVARRFTLINEADADGNKALHWAIVSYRRRCSRSVRVPTPVTMPARSQPKEHRRRQRGETSPAVSSSDHGRSSSVEAVSSSPSSSP
ncbi:hypothetical protein SBRCBS47491_009950 [Sporothrix bragantina]|uniref:Uncharacterized protein n=1 Tax=Sporothrix bragantina TaxID=671064 RepID=A0ABP0D013_9PEZI